MICINGNCEKELTGYQKKFCSRSCSAAVNNLGRRRHGEAPIDCLNCGKRTRKSNQKYCSSKCNQEYVWNLRKLKIEQDGFETASKSAKRYLIETRGHKCEICDRTEWDGQLIPLVLDHIDGNSENNYLINLRNVCGNCDMLLPTYKSKNKGNGRHSRRVRYAAGKSY